jgi:anti-sigma factor RsiW
MIDPSNPQGEVSRRTPDSAVDGHVTPERIADAHAGLATSQEAQAVAAHLESCPDCAAAAADIHAVPRRLAALAADVIPASVSRALQITIAGEVARRESQQRATRHSTGSGTADGPSSPRETSPHKRDLWNGSPSAVDR